MLLWSGLRVEIGVATYACTVVQDIIAGPGYGLAELRVPGHGASHNLYIDCNNVLQQNSPFPAL